MKMNFSFYRIWLKTHFISLWRGPKMNFPCPLRFYYTAIRPFCDMMAALGEELGWMKMACFLSIFYLILWFYVFWNGFYTRKVILIQLQEFATPPYCRCCSVTKRSDSGIAEALKALKMHFWDPWQWDKMCFEYHKVIFLCKNGSKFLHLLTVRAEVADLPPPP